MQSDDDEDSPPGLVDLVIESDGWEETGLADLAGRAIRAGLEEIGLAGDGLTLCLLACDDARIAALNADFRGKPRPTNVLSWPSEERGASAEGARPDLPLPGSADDPEHLGDIAISHDTCRAEAEAAGKPLADHLTHLILHGFLHLLGYDHIREGDAALMEGIETRALARLGLSDPYCERIP